MSARVLPLLLIAAHIVTAAAATAQEVAWPEVGKLIASDPEPQAFFAHALAIDRDRLVIGALFDNGSDGDSGSVYVFERQADGAWLEVAKLVPSDDGGYMGTSVAVSGDLIVAGASGVEPDGGAYVFERDPVSGAWIEVAKLASRGDSEDWGTSVAVSGTTVVVSAIVADDKGLNAGAAYVFERGTGGGPGGWRPVAKLTASDGTSGDYFGSSAAMQGERLVIGARLANDGGAAYVFERDEGDTWTEVANLLASDRVSGDSFGTSVALSGDRVIAGAPQHDAVGNEAGAASIFDQQGDGRWLEVAKLLPTAGGGHFGESVAISGDRAVAGAPNADDPFSGTGAAYVYERQADGRWPEVARLVASDRDGSENLGTAVALEGATVVAGADSEDLLAENSNNGAAYVYVRVSPELATRGACPGPVEVLLSGVTPGRPVALLWGESEGTRVVPGGPCAGVELDLAQPRLLGVRTSDRLGELRMRGNLGPLGCGRLLQALDATTCLPSPLAPIP